MKILKVTNCHLIYKNSLNLSHTELKHKFVVFMTKFQKQTQYGYEYEFDLIKKPTPAVTVSNENWTLINLSYGSEVFNDLDQPKHRDQGR